MYKNKKKEHIVYCITKSNFGGAQKYLLHLALYNKKKGHRITVIFGSENGEKNTEVGDLSLFLKKNAIPYIYISSLVRSPHIFLDIKTLFTLSSYFKKISPTIVHTMSSKAGFLGVFSARIAGIPLIIFTAHGFAHEEKWRKKIIRFLFYCITVFTQWGAHKNIHLTKDTLEKSKKMPFLKKEKLVHIPNGIPFLPPLSKEKIENSLSPFHFKKHKETLLTLLTIAEISKNKNIEAILSAQKILYEKNIFTQSVIIGPFTDTALYKELCVLKKNLPPFSVTFTGSIKDASRFMPYFDIFLLPSHKEGFPFVLLEAGKNKLPIIASDIPSLREVLQGGKYGTLISPTPLKIAETLHAHAKEKKHSAQKKAKNFSFAVEKYHTLEKMCEKTHSLYESGAGRPSSSLSASE